MKKFLTILALASLAIACQKEPEVTPSVTVTTPSDVTIAQEGGNATVEFNANVAWTVSIDNSAFKVSPTSGEAGTCTVKVTALQNDTEDAVVANLTITAQSASAKVKFTQLQKDALIVEVTEKEIDCNEQDFYIDVKSNIEYTAKVADDCNWMIVSEGTKAVTTSQIHVGVDANKGEAREGSIIISGAGKNIEFVVKQAEFVPVFEVVDMAAAEDGNYYFDVPKEGGSYEFALNTNIDYEFEPYTETFPTQHVTRDGNKYKVTIDPNNWYEPITTYIKFTVSGKDEEGNDVTVKIKVYFMQTGFEYVKYSISMYDMEFDTWGTTVLSEAVYNGKHYVSNGQDLYEINPADGTWKKIDWAWGNGMTQKVISNDDAGNLIVCNHTAYSGDYLDGYFILNAVTPAGTETNVITKAAWECGGPFGAKIAVRGDITSEALICGVVEGIADVTMNNIIGYWEVNGGVAGDYVSFGVDENYVGTWGTSYWNTYPNNCPSVAPLGTKADNGFFVSGSYEGNIEYLVSKDGITMPVFLPDPEQSGNYGYQTVYGAVYNGVTYLVSVASTFFPSYGITPVISLVDIDHLTEVGAVIHDVAKLNVNGATYFALDWDYGISPASDVKIYDAGNGLLGIAYVDLNGRCVEAFEIDPAK